MQSVATSITGRVLSLSFSMLRASLVNPAIVSLASNTSTGKINTSYFEPQRSARLSMPKCTGISSGRKMRAASAAARGSAVSRFSIRRYFFTFFPSF